MNMRRKLLEIAYPVTRWIGKTHLPFTHKKIRSADYRQIADCLVPGAVLLSRVKGEVSNLFIPGYWTHAAIVAAGCTHVIEATFGGVIKTDLIDFCMSKDAVAVMSSIHKRGETAAYHAEKYVGLPYDFYFEAGVNAFYCAELIFAAYKLDAGLRGDGDIFGEPIYTPQMIYDDRNTWFHVLTIR